MFGRSAILAEGTNIDPKDAATAGVNLVSGEFFGALDILLMAGRTFSPQDRAGATDVAILSAGLARKLFGGADPIGRRVRIDGQPPDRWLSVIAVSYTHLDVYKRQARSSTRS